MITIKIICAIIIILLFYVTYKLEKIQKETIEVASENYAYRCIVDKLQKQNIILHNCLDKIDWHIRGMQNERIITMEQMVVALKVISDNLQALTEIERIEKGLK